MHILMISVLFAVVSADPAIYLSGGLVSSPLTSAALIAPAAAPVIAPAAPISQLASYPVTPYTSVASLAQITAPVPPAAPVSPVAPVAPLSQIISDYRYAYGSSYSYQDYVPVVNSGLSLPYSLPYAYAADWYYRK